MATVPLTRLQVLQGRLDAYLAAELKILNAQSYQVGDGSTARNLQRAQLEAVQKGIAELQGQIAVETLTSTGTRRVLYLR